MTCSTSAASAADHAARSATGLKTPAPDIGQRPAWQEKRSPAAGQEPSFDAFSQREPVPTSLENVCSAAQAGQEAAPAAGLALRRPHLFREFVADGFVIDPGIVRRPQNRNHWQNS